MPYEWVTQYCEEKPGVIREWKVEWECFRYLVGGKMFLMEGANKEGKAILTLKLEPLHGELARKTYSCVEPGYYMNKEHWNSIFKDGFVPDDVLKEYLDESYRLIVASLPKKLQQELSGEKNI